MDLNRRGIASLPSLASLACASQIRVVAISSNDQLSELPAQLFAGTPNLNQLAVWNNDKLTSLRPGLFSKTPRLRIVAIYNNDALHSLCASHIRVPCVCRVCAYVPCVCHACPCTHRWMAGWVIQRDYYNSYRFCHKYHDRESIN